MKARFRISVSELSFTSSQMKISCRMKSEIEEICSETKGTVCAEQTASSQHVLMGALERGRNHPLCDSSKQPLGLPHPVPCEDGAIGEQTLKVR